jgi:hypothetical protein
VHPRGGSTFSAASRIIDIFVIGLSKYGPPRCQGSLHVILRKPSYKINPATTPRKILVAATPAAALVPAVIGIGAGGTMVAPAVFEKVAVNRNALATVAHKTFFIRPSKIIWY